MTMLFLILFFTIVFYLDFKYHETPNWLNVVAFFIGIGADFQWGHLYHSIFQALIGLLILLPPYVLGWVGGGDVKFVMALGSLMSLSMMLHAILFGLVLAGILSTVVLIYKGNMKKMWLSVKYSLQIVGGTYSPTMMFIPLGSCISLVGLLLIILQYGW